MDPVKSSRVLRDLRTVFRVTPVGKKQIDGALSSKFEAFEDAIQYDSALEIGAGSLLTRNRDDFEETELIILRPEEYLAFLKSSDE